MNRTKIISDYVEAFVAYNHKLPTLEAKKDTIVIAMGYEDNVEIYTFSYDDLMQLTRNLLQSIKFRRSIEEKNRNFSNLVRCLASVNISEVTEYFQRNATVHATKRSTI